MITAKRRQLSQRDHGFTLVELMVAMMVIASVLLMLIGVQIAAAQTIKDGRMRQQATALANESLEQMRAIPWSVLTAGLHPDYDKHRVTGGVLRAGDYEFNLRVAGAGVQSTASPWSPLFDGTGSNTRIWTDPSGTEFTIRSYVTEPTIGTDGVGLAVIVDWVDTRGRDQFTVIEAPSFAALSCHTDESRSPFAGACQAMLSAASSTGAMTSVLSAWQVDPVTNDRTRLSVLPGRTEYSVEVTTAVTTATVLAEQTAVVEGAAQYGFTATATNPSVTPTTTDIRGVQSLKLSASNDPPVPGAIPPNPAPISALYPLANESPRELTGGGLGFRMRSDAGRPGGVTSTTVNSCRTGIPAGEPCTQATLTNLSSDSNGTNASGYLVMDMGSGPNPDVFRFVRRLNESGGNTDTAWAARFSSTPGSASIGCTTLTGAGCAAAGAERNLGTVAYGTILTGGSWDHGNSHLVVVTNLSESVKVDRGTSQKATIPASIPRTGSVSFWNGSLWQTVTLTPETNGIYEIGPSTYTSSHAGYSVEVTSGQVLITPYTIETVGSDPACEASACQITATGGTISVTYELLVRTPTRPDGFTVSFGSTINPVRATATYKDAPSS